MTRHSTEDREIVARDLTMSFKTIVRPAGFWAGCRSVVAPVRTTRTVVDGVSLNVHGGELVALLGPNGAGKSTIIKMLTGILAPTSGSVLVGGLHPHQNRQSNARQIGAVFGQRTQLWWDLPARQSLEILKDIFEVPDHNYRRRLAEFDDILRLSEFWDTRVRHLSLGQRVRCDLAAALLHDPMIVFLDEPTIGMDVVVKEQVRDFIAYQVRQRGRAVLLTTHDMPEVSRLADRAVLVDKGKVFFSGGLPELATKVGEMWQLSVTFAGHFHGPSVPGVQLLRQEGDRSVFGPAMHGHSEAIGGGGSEDNSFVTPHEALRRIVQRHSITDFQITENGLEDVMRSVFARKDGLE